MKIARFKKAIIVSIVVLLASTQLSFGKTEVLFSPRGQIDETIIKTINASENSIDIAVFIFTSGDIAEALLMAKERGVKIRIVLDEKQGKKQHPILEFLRDEGFDMQYLKGNVGGFMHNTFAIFDDKLVITGSYNWTEYAEKFNYENAILIDEQEVISQFQEEFKILFQKSVKRIAKANRPISVDSVSIPESETEYQVIKPSIELSETFLNISFEEFDDLFGTGSRMENSEKKELWKKKFKDKYIKWRGTVFYKGISLYDWNKIGISHKNNEEADVQIKFDWTKKEKVRLLKIGDTITYIGRLISLRGLTSPYKLDDCDIVK